MHLGHHDSARAIIEDGIVLVKKPRDGITAFPIGGLGNQLFILGAGWEQARRLGCPLYLDASYFRVYARHPYGLDALANPGQRLTPAESVWYTVRLPNGRHIPLPRRRPGRVYRERAISRYSPDIDTVRRGTTLFGYFQSYRYFPSVRATLIESLWSVPESADETAILNAMRTQRVITLHLRRGDYLTVPDSRVFLASVDYARRALAVLRRMGVDLPVRVFTDSVARVRAELGGADEGFEFVDSELPLSPIATLKAMAAGDAMIMSNSSFSWWAAALMASRRGGNVESPIVAPRPWNALGEARADMLEPEWLTVDAR